MTRIDPDDPKWTAYVLGELDGAERAAVELEISSSEEARMLVEELRLAADLTKTELREAVTVAPLTEWQRETIYASVQVPRFRRWMGMYRASWGTGLAAASVAVIALTVAVAPMLFHTRNENPAPSPAAVVETPQAQEPAAAPAKDQAEPTGKFRLRYEHAAAPPATSPAAEPQSAQLNATGTSAVEAPQVTPGLAPAHAEPAPVPAEPARQITAPATIRVFGTVQDASAAYIPGVAVTATNIQTGIAATTVTNESGAYAFAGLQPGRYRLSGELPGFRTSVHEGVQLSANAPARHDMTLQIGSVSETVEITANAGTLLSTSSGNAAETGRGAGIGGVAGGVLRAQQEQQSQPGQPRQQVTLPLSAATAFVQPSLPFPTPGAPGVPPPFDRTRPGFYNGAETYDAINDNPFLPVAQNPLSTFSIDVDTASYSNVRRYLNQNQRPPRDAVRIEEMVNYFSYDYPEPQENNPIGAAIEAASAPWNPQHRLVRIAIKAKDVDARRRPASNLVFLLDVSGSMQPEERLPLLKTAFRMLVEQLTANDRVTVVTYAGTTGVALRPARGDQKDVILDLINSLQAGGSTNGGSGIHLAYDQAVANFIPGGVNRVILATDGDFNVGITDRNALLRLIEDKARSGVFLSVLGVGMGNYKDATLESLAGKGNGNYAYLDTLNEARKFLVDQMNGTLITVAKDVKVQVEFNPAVVDAYRLIGYENRALRNEDFNNDLKDAGDIGAGHTVTVLYEVVPRGVAINVPGVDPLKYQQQPAPPAAPNASNETLTVKIRYKEPAGSDSKLLVFPLVDRQQAFARSSADFRFAAAVASFGMILRDSPYKGTAAIDSVLSIAEDSMGSDRNGYRREFLQLVQRARQVRVR